MCTGIEIAGLVASAVGTASQVDQANRARRFSNYAAAQGIEDAKAEVLRAETVAEKVRRAGRAQAAEAKSSLAASGVAAGEGTALLIAEDIASRVESDAMAELLTGQQRGRRMETESYLVRQAGKNQQREAYASGAGSLLQTGAKGYTAWKGSPKGGE